MPNQPADHEIRHMRYLLETVTTGTGIPASRGEKKERDREDIRARILGLSEHLYRHIQRMSAEDVQRGLQNPMDAIYASQTIDGLYEAFKQGDPDHIFDMSRQLHSYFENLTEDEIALMLGQDAFSGEEIDVYGLISTIGATLAEYDNFGSLPLQESANSNEYFGRLVNDLVTMINKWSRKDIYVTEGADNGLDGKDCIEDIVELLEQKYGISLNRHDD